MDILTVNTGSSSVRLGLFDKSSNGLSRVQERRVKPDEDVPEYLLKSFLRERTRSITVAAHRIVHGGSTLSKSCIISDKVEEEISRLSVLAPLHNPVALRWVKACRAVIGKDIPQIAVFDTAFYSTMPDVSGIYALPKDLCDKYGIYRYGFHGIAHQSMSLRWHELKPDLKTGERVISIQLGSGCSVTAIEQGNPIDTSMGFSPLEGLMMSTRAGDIDPGVLIYIQNEAGLSVNEIDRLLNRSSGLLGVSGLSGDMRVLLESEEPAASLAVDLYCYRVKKYIGAYIAALGGIDCIIFGGGVGENAPLIRKKILDNMEWCGISLDRHANNETTGKEGYISSDNSMVDVIVISVDEGPVLASEAVEINI